MKNKINKKARGDWLVVFILFVAHYISFNIIGGLVFNILGVVFFAGMCYGIISIFNKYKFVY